MSESVLTQTEARLPKVERGVAFDYPDLKQQLLAGKITPEDFRNTLIALDQSTGSRFAAILNYRFVKDEEIKDYLTRKRYCDAINKPVITRLIHGLERYNSLDYARDYLGAGSSS